MKFCQDHWDRLRKAIDDRGLTRFVAKDGEQAAKQMAEQMSGTSDPTNPYDPLMAAHWAIINKIMEYAGPAALSLFAHDPDHPERECPLCLVMENTKDCQCGTLDHAQEWIDSCCDFFRDEFKKNGWLKEPSVH